MEPAQWRGKEDHQRRGVHRLCLPYYRPIYGGSSVSYEAVAQLSLSRSDERLVTRKDMCKQILTASIIAVAWFAPAMADQTYPPPQGYPPGWNTRSEDPSAIIYDFRPGVREDDKRYWPSERRAFYGAVPSHPIPYGLDK